MQLSKQRVYQAGAVAVIPVAVYNLVVALSDLDALALHTKSLIGGVTLLILSGFLAYRSFYAQGTFSLCAPRSS